MCRIEERPREGSGKTKPTTAVTKKERPSEGSERVELSLVDKKKKTDSTRKIKGAVFCFGSKTKKQQQQQ